MNRDRFDLVPFILSLAGLITGLIAIILLIINT